MSRGAAINHGDAVVCSGVVVDMIVATKAGSDSQFLQQSKGTTIFTIRADFFLFQAVGAACFPNVDVLLNRNVKEAEGVFGPIFQSADFF